MVMNRETLLKAYPAVPETVTTRMEETLRKLRCESVSPKRCKPLRRPAFVLMVLLILLAAVGGTAAALHFGVFDLMTKLFGQGGVLPQAGQMVVEDLACVERAHSVLAVEEAVYDGGSLRLVYSVRSTEKELSIQEAAATDQVSLNGCDWFTLNGETIVMTGGSAFGSVMAPEGDRLLCYLDIYLTSSGITPEGTLSVGLPLIDGETVDFTVPGYQATASPAVVETDTLRATLLTASLSPVRAYARLCIEKQPHASAADFEAALGDWMDAYLADAEGTILSTPTEILTTAVEESRIELTYIFLPVESDGVFFAPTQITPENEWMVDMAHALPMQ